MTKTERLLELETKFIGKEIRKISGNTFPDGSTTGIVSNVVVEPIIFGTASIREEDYRYYLVFSGTNSIKIAPDKVELTGKKGKKIICKLTDFEIARKYLNHYQRAADRGIPCTLSFSRYKALLKQKNCFYTGLPFIPDSKDDCLSLDRVMNDKGYHDNNVVACLARINTAKGNMSLGDIKLLWEKMDNFHYRVKK